MSPLLCRGDIKMIILHVFVFKNLKLYVNKRAMMALDLSPDPSTTYKQYLRQASWPSLMAIE
jgi:hypothetical protein